MFPELVGVKLPELKVSVTVPVLVTNSPEKVATPLAVVTVTGVIPPAFKLPPLVSAAVITVLELSTVLPY